MPRDAVFTLLRLRIAVLLALLAAGAGAQEDKPFSFERDLGFGSFPNLGGPKLDDSELTLSAFIVPPRGETPALLAVQAEVPEGWHVYSITQPDGGPLRTEIEVDSSPAFSLAASFQPDTPPKHSSNEEVWPGVTVEEHHGVVTWLAPLKLAGESEVSSLEISGKISGQLCTDNQGVGAVCKPFGPPGQSAVAWTAKLASDEQLASLREIPTFTSPPSTSDVAGVPESIGKFVPRAGNPIIRGHIEPKVVAPGETARLVLSIEPQAGWHVYAREDQVPSIGARPTLVVLTESSGLAPLAPATAAKIVVEPDQQYYDGPVTWAVQIPIPKNASPGDYKIAGLLGYQLCSARTCDTPTGVQFRGVVAVGASSVSGTLPLGFDAGSYSAAMNALATRVAWSEGSASVVNYDSIAAQARAKRASVPMAAWLGIAVLAGFILNFMPCVLPVIGLKVMSFVQQAGEDRKQIFLLNMVYALGMISVFWVLATLAVFLNFSWGDQFQSVEFNVALAAIVFAFALSFLGVWEVPIPGFVGSGSASQLAEREGLGGAFAKGILTTLLATPCTGPLLGPALGWAVEQPPLYAYLAFTCVGLGMALPYVVIGAQPSLLKFLPRPGAWMETFKNIMGFVLMATVVFILTYIPWEYVVPTVAFIIGLWGACWWIGRKQLEGLDTNKMLVQWAGAATFAVIVGMVSFLWLSEVMRARLETLITQRIGAALEGTPSAEPSEAVRNASLAPHESSFELPWETFSQAALEQHIAAGRTVFVDFTADWCLVCKNNERAALNVEPMRKLVDDYGVVTLKADLTRHSPELKEMMRKLGHSSGALPFYAVFPAGKPNEPILFSGWQTPSFFLDQIRAAGPSRSPVAARTARMPTP